MSENNVELSATMKRASSLFDLSDHKFPDVEDLTLNEPPCDSPHLWPPSSLTLPLRDPSPSEDGFRVSSWGALLADKETQTNAAYSPAFPTDATMAVKNWVNLLVLAIT